MAGKGARLLNGVQAVRVNVDPPNLAAGAEADQDVAVANVAVGDLVLGVTPSGVVNAGYYLRRALVQAAGQIRLTWRNETAGAVDPAALDLTFLFIPLGDTSLTGFPGI